MATVIFDADDTLWRGLILHEDPPALFSGVHDVVKELGKRGHRVVVCSRNDPERLVQILTKFDLLPYLAEVRAGWGPKSEGVGIETALAQGEPVLFIDDDPFNRAEVQAVVPGVTVLAPPADPLTILDHPLLGPVGRATTSEDRRRVRLLKEQRARDADAPAASDRTAYEQFLRDSTLALTIYPTRDLLPDHGRALDILNRTTELRTNRLHYRRLPEQAWLVGASLRDRYGDYGFIGMAVIAADATHKIGTIQDVAVSCRTMGRGIGTSLVAWICRAAFSRGITTLCGYITPDDRNGPMRELYQFLGFTAQPSEDRQIEVWARHLAAGDLPALSPWLTVTVTK